jgi:PIN domain nuclease of toxin-antitoxin system
MGTVRYLLDTCTFLWLTSEPARLSAKAVSLLDDSTLDFVVSDVSLWEICLKWQSGKLNLPDPPRTWCESQLNTWSFPTLAINRSSLYRATELPDHHRDPFDRLLIAQCLEESLAILTPDLYIAKYPVSTVW